MSNKFIKDGMLLMIAKLFSMVSSALVAIFIARYYGVSIYGAYTTAIAFTTFICTFTDLGLDSYMLKECSRNLDNLNKLYRNVMTIKLIILLITSILIVLLSNLVGYEGDIKKLIIILLPNIMITYIINTFFVIMQVKGRLHINAKIQISQNALIIIVALLTIIFKFNIYLYSLLQSIISIIVLCIYVYISNMKFKPSIKYSKIIIKGSILFGLSSLLYIIYYK